MSNVNDPWKPDEVIAVPRAVFETWRDRPFLEMVHAAETGEDGLYRVGSKDAHLPKADVCHFRATRSYEHFAKGTALLYAQGWRGEE